MTEQAMLHIPDSQYCFAEDERTVVLRLRLSKSDAPDSVAVVYGGKYDFARRQNRAELNLAVSDRLFNYYSVRLTLGDVRLVYVFRIEEKNRTYFFSEDGLTETFDFDLAYYNAFQLPYINAADVMRPVRWMESAVFYQIFVDRFFRGDFRKDGSYINLAWGEVPDPKSFAGGDLRGVIDKLGYLESFGINVIYLTPVFRSVSNHKYDISDYYVIDRQFGTNEDFAELVKLAHARGIRIVLDAVFNHCSSDLPQFRDVMEKGRESEYFDWFLIDGDFPNPKKMNYECFGSCEYMPKLNTSDAGVRKFLLDVATHWIREYDIDGWRLDVSDEVSHDFWRSFRSEVKALKQDCVIIGENWHDAHPYLGGDQYDGIMNYAFTKASLDFFVRKSLGAREFADRLGGLLMRNSDTVNSMMLNLLDSHDTHRFLSQLNGDEDRLLAALAVMFCFPGAPCIYYGTEIGMTGGYDPDCRRTFDWDRAGTVTEFGRTIRKLIELRTTSVALGKGTLKLGEKDGLFVLVRGHGDSETALLVNNGSHPLPVAGVHPAGTAAISGGLQDGMLAGGGFAIFLNE